MKDVTNRPSRRALLGGLGVTSVAGLAGCTDRLWTRAENPPADPVSIDVKTLPADDDVVAAGIAGRLVESLRECGIESNQEPVTESELYREVLINREFDMFVARHPGFDEFDALRGVLHSQFVGERGWQNPFSYSSPTIDELLEVQVDESGTERSETVEALFEYLGETTPYVAIAFPDHLGATRDDFGIERPPREPLDYIDILGGGYPEAESETDSGDDDEDESLRIGVFGEGVFDQFNPILVGHVGAEAILGLLYDPLVRTNGDESIPWLAEDVEWDEEGGIIQAEVRLRDGLTWHDEEPIEATDVEFTNEFLADTSLGEADNEIPAPRFRSRVTLIDHVTVLDSRTVRIVFSGASESVMERALTVPVLPAHHWEERTEVIGDQQTEALAWDNEEPVGSGLFEFTGSDDETITLEPFDDHVLRNESDGPAVLDDFPRYDGIEFALGPNPGAVLEAVVDDSIDLVGSELPAEFYESEEHEDESISWIDRPTDSFYLLGFNTRNPDLSNPQVRRVVSQMLDREWLVDELLDGAGRPAIGHRSVLGFEDEEDSGVSELADFYGIDGELDEVTVRSEFESIGYRYEEDSLLE